MSSNLVLFSCVVQAVLFGCMVPDTKGEVPSKNYLEWLVRDTRNYEFCTHTSGLWQAFFFPLKKTKICPRYSLKTPNILKYTRSLSVRG